MSLLDESLAISTELGMRPLMERVLVITSTAKRSLGSFNPALFTLRHRLQRDSKIALTLPLLTIVEDDGHVALPPPDVIRPQ